MYTIGNAARLAGVSADTLRYYEKEGLIAPEAKSAAGYRLYDDAAARRIRFIKQAQQCGFTLADIKELLTLKTTSGVCCEDVRNLAIEKKLRIEYKLRALQTMSRALDDLIHRCEGGEKTIDACAILGTLESGLREETA